MKINTNNFIEKPFKPDTWYKIDLLIDWTTRKVGLFVDNVFFIKEDFYSKERDKDLACNCTKEDLNCWDDVGVNTLMLYSLTPGTTSFFRDVRVCEEFCDELFTDPEPMPKAPESNLEAEAPATLEECEEESSVVVTEENPRLKFDEALFKKHFSRASGVQVALATLLTFVYALY